MDCAGPRTSDIIGKTGAGDAMTDKAGGLRLTDQQRVYWLRLRHGGGMVSVS